MTTEKKLQAKLRDERDREQQIEPIKCVDGTTLSVQASRYHYCAPRDNSGPWSAVEVGFPSAKIDALMKYAENPDDPTETVYGYVPIEIVAAAIDAHGGIKDPT